ncbi:Brix domain containing protein [Nitzschia inconspicua]|uniref:Ribosome production factor 2 homolog n=1 Tax=Nitzschia inconspicua TaxID=303405 RepID=A0A9K3PZT1_9STRA|nr:Brix domain containing protein [Nitzschia inconspicua]
MAPTEAQLKASKAKILAGGKPAKARTQRYLKSIEPQLKERAKSTLLLKGIKCSQAMGNLIKDMRAMQAPNAKLLTKKNQIVAFDMDGQKSLEFLTTKNDCALFALASTNKKRPNNLVMGRTFDHQLLDMVELGILRYKGIHDYGGSVPKKRMGSKPLMLFIGDLWQRDSNCQKMLNLLIDFYRGDVVDKLVVSGIDHLLMFVASHDPAVTTSNSSSSTPPRVIIHQHTYFCKLKKDPNDPTSKVPVPFLVPCGPDVTMQIRRAQFAEPDLWKQSLKQPQGLQKKKAKNHSTNLFGEVIGRLHLEKQEVDKMGGRKSKALRRAEKAAAEEEREAIEAELGKEEQDLKQEFKQTFGFES